MTRESSSIKAIRLASWITALNVLAASGFALVGLLRPELMLPTGFVSTEASHVFALYAAARTIPLALITLAVIYWRWTQALFILGVLAGVVQLADAAIGLYQPDFGKTIGPLTIAMLQFYSVYRIYQTHETWRS